mgnify:CR=1 FL=1
MAVPIKLLSHRIDREIDPLLNQVNQGYLEESVEIFLQ